MRTARAALRALVVVCLSCMGAGAAAAQDTVHVALGEGGRASTRISGEVLDYSGAELKIRVVGGAVRTFAVDRVLQIETVRGEQHLQADRLFDEGNYAAALELYARAQIAEARRWMRREILAQIVRCNTNLGNYESAGEFFLTLVGDDPQSPWFDCIPINWTPAQPPASLERRADSWLQRGSVGKLLAASHLLATPRRSQMLQELDALRTDRDERIAALARSLAWRGVTNVTQPAVEQWQRELQKMPLSLRAGGYYQIGAGFSRLGRHEDAALAWLHIPVLYATQRWLAARALIEAGRSLQRAEQPDEAARLFHEVTEQYADTPSAQEARQLLAPRS